MIEKDGKTVEEATEAALAELGVSADEADVEVLSKAHRGGILGFMGQPVVRVRVSVKGEDQPEPAPPAEGSAPESETTEPAAAEPEEKAPEGEATAETTEAAQSEPEAEAAPSSSTPQPTEAEPDEAASDGVAPAADREDEDLEEEGEVLDWAEESRLLVQDLLDAMDLDLTAEVAEFEGEDLRIDTSGPDLGILIGRQGRTINAFQYLVNVILNRQSPERLRVVIDGEGYRRRRERALQKSAQQAAERARRSGVAVRMEPLRAFERRLVHVALQDDGSVTTHSEGEEPYRRVVVTPVGFEGDDDFLDQSRGTYSDDFERRWIEEDEREDEKLDEDVEFFEEEATDDDSSEEAESAAEPEEEEDPVVQ